MKRLLAMLLVLVLSVGLFAGCQKETQPTQPAGQAQTPSEEQLPPVEDDGVMKILLIGHSLGTDASFMFPDVCKNEGMENLIFGRLYHSGCRMVQHVDYLRDNAAQYSYDEYDISKDDCWKRAYADGSWQELVPGTATDIYIEDGTVAQTMQFGIQRHDWDIIIMQCASYEGANVKDSYYTTNGHELDLTGYTQELMDYVLANDIEPRTAPKFAWNLIWSKPADRNVWTDANKTMMDRHFNGDEYLLYTEMMRVFQAEMLPAFDFAYVLPSGTAMQNLKSTSLKNTDIYRDYGHATDYGRLAAAYSWYCTMFGKNIEDCTIPAMNYKVVLDKFARQYQKDWELTEAQRAIFIECVGNAVKKPYERTQSQY